MTVPEKRATDRSSLIARLEGVIGLDLTVMRIQHRSPSLLEIHLESEQLRGLVVGAGQDVMVEVPLPRGQHVRRRYTMVDVDAEAGTMSLLIALKGSGAGEEWALNLQVGDVIDAVGPRGKQPVNTEATHHLFIADHSAVGATAQMVRSLTSGRVTVVQGFPSVEDVLHLVAGSEAVDLRVVTLAPVAHGDVAPFIEALAETNETTLLAPDLQCYVNAEFSIVNDVRTLLSNRGVDPRRIATKPYWRRNRSNAPHGEPIKD
jgi:NADPH-dependent ferric siderophore reductase